MAPASRKRKRPKQKRIHVLARVKGHCHLCQSVSSSRWFHSKTWKGEKLCACCAAEERRSLRDELDVIIAPSVLHGRGLFAMKNFNIDDIITMYSGNNAEPAPPYKEGDEKGRSLLGPGINEDANKMMRPFIGHFCNGTACAPEDAIISKNEGFDLIPNAKFSSKKIRNEMKWCKRGTVIATKNIEKGEEIITYYGNSFFK